MKENHEKQETNECRYHRVPPNQGVLSRKWGCEGKRGSLGNRVRGGGGGKRKRDGRGE